MNQSNILQYTVLISSGGPEPTVTTYPRPGGDVNAVFIAVVTIVAFMLVLIGITVFCILLVAVLRCVCRGGKVNFYPAQRRGKRHGIDNPVYDVAEQNPNIELTESEELSRSIAIDKSYMSMSGRHNQVPYEYSYARAISDDTQPAHSRSIIVPTMAQRRTMTKTFEESCNMTEQELYESLALKGARPYEVPQIMNPSDDTAAFWEPSSDCEGIYEQFAIRKFREIFRQQIKIVSYLGSGQFGNVEKGVWLTPRGTIDVAVKTLKTEATEQEMVLFLQEAAIMGQFHHPNVVKLHGVVTVGKPTMIVLEFMKTGDLRQHLQALKPNPGELAPSSLPKQLLGYCRQIASGMEYLSKKGFVHRDLAARNILVDDNATCKVADFGMSRDLHADSYYVSHGGQIPIKWTAPEALRFKKYSTASDVWSFGVLMYEIWSLGHRPFEGKSNQEAFDLIKTGYRLAPPPGCTKELYRIMIQCWHPETSGRPSFTALVTGLSQQEGKLLKWTSKDKTHPQSTMLGAPLETASNLHSDLQQQYV